jgi:pyruvyl transferase EpsI
LKRFLKANLNSEIYARLRNYKVVIRRYWLFFTKGGAGYLTVEGIINQMGKRWKNRVAKLRGYPGKRILWVGCFPAWHRNVGDQAQTHALELFFEDKYPDHHLITFTRHEVGSRRWEKIVKLINSDDFVFIHSTGDFGSKYYQQKFYRGGLSWTEVRRKIVAEFPNNHVVQLPVSVFYQEGAEGEQVAKDDRLAYAGKNFMVMCREGASLEILNDRKICEAIFFPDFVFYLNPEKTKRQRSKILLMLRGPDKESIFDDDQKNRIRELLESASLNVEFNDIMAARFPMFPSIRKKYMDVLARKYQEYELVVTDRMHGMIMAVITNTPSIALDEAIPHKLSGYRSMLGDSVAFVSDCREIPSVAGQVLGESYIETDLRKYFENFREYPQQDRLSA